MHCRSWVLTFCIINKTTFAAYWLIDWSSTRTAAAGWADCRDRDPGESVGIRSDGSVSSTQFYSNYFSALIDSLLKHYCGVLYNTR